ncbi:MAG: Omp28-related outer membrane protein, partial [Candidatus Marinimicrobia bacterium]|nr:Omp28-related outer membrane protein [Candidatus Neomarinimicrobiota bacterium]
MNQYIKILVFGLLVFSGCEDGSEDFEVSKVPSTFTKKVLIEEFTGAWCGYCPDGAYRVKNLINDNDGRVVGVSLHAGNPTGDAMEIAHTNYLETTYQNTGFPSGMVDRVSVNGSTSLNRGYWEYVANDQLAKTAVCGLAIISEVNGQNANVEVHAGFSSTPSGADYRLTVYLIEDGVTGEGYGYDQRNYDNTIAESPFYNLGDPIIGYEHNH